MEASAPSQSPTDDDDDREFEFSAPLLVGPRGDPMCPADELFLDGRIRPLMGAGGGPGGVNSNSSASAANFTEEERFALSVFIDEEFEESVKRGAVAGGGPSLEGKQISELQLYDHDDDDRMRHRHLLNRERWRWPTEEDQPGSDYYSYYAANPDQELNYERIKASDSSPPRLRSAFRCLNNCYSDNNDNDNNNDNINLNPHLAASDKCSCAPKLRSVKDLLRIRDSRIHDNRIRVNYSPVIRIKSSNPSSSSSISSSSSSIAPCHDDAEYKFYTESIKRHPYPRSFLACLGFVFRNASA